MCTSPLKAFPNGLTKNGKVNYIICPADTNHVEITRNEKIIKSPDRFVSDYAKRVIFDHIDVPCGQCLECRLDYSRHWADRMILEAQKYDKNCFLTLTYSDEFIPVADSINSVTGEVTKVKTLVKSDLQKFMKRLRKELDPLKIRYYACGEYGDQTLRPHYHLIIFGWYPAEDDLIPLGNSELNHCYYSSELLAKVWPYGNNLVAECSWESCAYVARYVVKKANKFTNTKFYEQNNIAPEFVLMSRKPGIGKEWIDSHITCYANFSKNYLALENGSRPISHNRYYDNILEKHDKEKFEEIKLQRKENAKQRNKLLHTVTSLDDLRLGHVRDRNLKNRTKVLERSKV